MTDQSGSYDRMPLALVVLFAVSLTVGAIASRCGPDAPEAAAPLPDLSNAQFAEVRDASGRTVLSGEFRERIDALGNVTRDAALVDRRGRRVIGEIEINLPGPNAMSFSQDVEIDIIEIKRNEKHSLFVDDREIATFMTDDRGSVDALFADGNRSS